MNHNSHAFKPIILIIALGALNLNSAILAADPLPPAGQLLASQCFQCHANVGGQNFGFDSITGESASEIIEEMNEMKRKAKPGSIMERHAKAYTETQIQQLAAYLASLAKSNGSNEDDDD